MSTPAATAEPITPEILLDIQYCKTWLDESYFKAISLATREAIGTALSPVAPINGLIFFLVKRLWILTNMMPPKIEMANARNPPTIIIKVLKSRKTWAVMVAPTVNPRKIVAVFSIEPVAASLSLATLIPISFSRVAKSNIPIRGTDEGTKSEITIPRTIGKAIFTALKFLIFSFVGYCLSIAFMLIKSSLLEHVSRTTSGIITGTNAI